MLAEWTNILKDKDLPDKLPDIKVTVQMDYLPQSGWWIAQVTDPEDWIWQGRGATAEEACDLAYAAAKNKYRDHVMMWYDYTDNGIEQSKIEDANDPTFLECELCNPPEASKS